MNRTRTAVAVLLALGATGLVGCSSSSSSNSNNGTPTENISGVITGFGSVFVNGVEYETTGASVQMDGVASDESSLEAGMVVSVQGRTNADGLTGVASAIHYADVTEGVVLAVNLTNGVGSLNVMGQTVQVNSLTLFDSDVPGITLDTIPPGSIAEVSGFTDGSGTIYATRIEIKKAALQPGDILEVKGVVSNLTATTFQLGDLVVNYSGATQVPGNLANGLHVEVKATAAPTDNGSGTYTLAATAVEIEGDGSIGIGGTDGDALHLQGVVTVFDMATSTMVVNGQMLKVRSDAMRDGKTFADLTPGTFIRLEAEHTQGDWLVKEIEIGRSSDVEIKANIEAIDLVAGTITLLGTSIIIDSNTLKQDGLTLNSQHAFDINDLAIGDRVEVDVYISAGQWFAAKLTREDPGTGVVLEGEVTSVAPVQVAGFNVTGLDALLGATPAVGTALEITGTWDGTSLTATSAVVLP